MLRRGPASCKMRANHTAACALPPMFTDLISDADAAANASAPDARARFFRLLDTAVASGRLHKLTLAGYRGIEPGLERVLVRPVQLKGQRCLSFVYRYATRDMTKNELVADGVVRLRALVGSDFHNAHLHTDADEVQLAFSRKGHASLRVGKAAGSAVPPGEAVGAAHNREKQRLVSLAQPHWVDLGLATPDHRLVPAMARKWKQVNKFVEVFAAALQASALAERDPAEPVRVADFGAGKGYLTFALAEYLWAQGRAARVEGIELRPDLVALCNAAAQRSGLAALRFCPGDLRSHAPGALDVMIALHACDTATDHALHLGLQAGASILLCSPCCHKQLRAQMQMPRTLRPLLQHGIHLGQEAEMVTDGLRALLLEAEGYDAQVFEFIALEHTAKNKMILAVKRRLPPAVEQRNELLAQIAEIKAFYGIHEQALESLRRPA